MAGSNNVKADHRRRPPAPPGRASDSELAEMVQLATKDSLLEALLDWIDGLVVVLNRHRQIVLASDTVARALHVDTDDLIGKRLGEAMGCVHVDMASGGCGTSEKCRYCGALKAILDAPRFDAPVETECRLTLRGKDHAETLKLRVKTSLTSRSPEPFTVVVLQGMHQLERAPTLYAHTSVDEDWPVGIASYEWVRKLGVGGMGTVFLVRDAEKREYALKTVKGVFLGDESVMSRFLKEIRLSIVLDHPSIVRTLRANQSDAGTVYMVTEYCPNGSAGQWLQRHGPIGPGVALSWMMACTQALHYAWQEHRLVHRDIKPDNLLLDGSNQPKIADFGVARRAVPTDPRLTQASSFVGTIHYMAPEQALGAGEADTRADLYGLGSTFFHLLSGETPFDGPNPASILRRKLKRPAPPIASVCRDLPVSLADTIQSLLATDPDDRPSDPGELLRRLTDIARSGALSLES